MFAAISIAISLMIWALPAMAACEEITFEGSGFTVCEANPQTDDIRLFLNGDDDTPLGTFHNVEEALDQRLSFAMNAGMYHPDRRPVGLYIENGVELAPIVTREGPGNFGLLPNGVLCLTENAALVIESRKFDSDRPDCVYATQSGPMLVIDGALHPRFLPNSSSKNVRNGVGVRAGGTMITAISDDRVTFDHFGRLFRDVLNTPDALFLDGSVSRLYAPLLNRHDLGLPMGPILGVTD
jgi:uncharacterized protein YigE (DUF2233 family)